MQKKKLTGSKGRNISCKNNTFFLLTLSCQNIRTSQRAKNTQNCTTVQNEQNFLHFFLLFQGSSSALLATLEKERELLRIFLRVSQMENTILRRMNLSSFLMVCSTPKLNSEELFQNFLDFCRYLSRG